MSPVRILLVASYNASSIFIKFHSMCFRFCCEKHRKVLPGKVSLTIHVRETC